MAHVWHHGDSRSAGSAVTPRMVKELPDFSHMLPADYRRGYSQWRAGQNRGAKGEPTSTEGCTADGILSQATAYMHMYEAEERAEQSTPLLVDAPRAVSEEAMAPFALVVQLSVAASGLVTLQPRGFRTDRPEARAAALAVWSQLVARLGGLARRSDVWRPPAMSPAFADGGVAGPTVSLGLLLGREGSVGLLLGCEPEAGGAPLGGATLGGGEDGEGEEGGEEEGDGDDDGRMRLAPEVLTAAYLWQRRWRSPTSPPHNLPPLLARPPRISPEAHPPRVPSPSPAPLSSPLRSRYSGTPPARPKPCRRWSWTLPSARAAEVLLAKLVDARAAEGWWCTSPPAERSALLCHTVPLQLAGEVADGQRATRATLLQYGAAVVGASLVVTLWQEPQHGTVDVGARGSDTARLGRDGGVVEAEVSPEISPRPIRDSGGAAKADGGSVTPDESGDAVDASGLFACLARWLGVCDGHLAAGTTAIFTLLTPEPREPHGSAGGRGGPRGKGTISLRPLPALLALPVQHLLPHGRYYRWALRTLARPMRSELLISGLSGLLQATYAAGPPFNPGPRPAPRPASRPDPLARRGRRLASPPRRRPTPTLTPTPTRRRRAVQVRHRGPVL